jgi:hypothetical protein
MTTTTQTASRAVYPAASGLGLAAYLQEVMAQTNRWFIHIQRERLNLFFSIAQPALWLIFFGGMFSAIDKS